MSAIIEMTLPTMPPAQRAPFRSGMSPPASSFDLRRATRVEAYVAPLRTAIVTP